MSNPILKHRLFQPLLTEAQMEANLSWVAALESGEYTQGTGTLKNLDGSFCVLGVACDLSGTGEWCDFPVGNVYPYMMGRRAFLCYPSDIVEGEYGMTRLGAYALLDLNDEGVQFEVLAQIIRAELLERS